ncbi:hypothetical protein Leryth_020922 [Lithospermum erythrorhizon]|nr:hypothetical protein Leryth_020922 [Lithospermum erythrorhizon]
MGIAGGVCDGWVGVWASVVGYERPRGRCFEVQGELGSEDEVRHCSLS